MISTDDKNVRFSTKHVLAFDGVEQIVACPELAATVDQFQGSQPAESIVEPPPFASYPALAATSSLVIALGYA